MDAHTIDTALDRLVRSLPEMSDETLMRFIRPNQFAPKERITALPGWAETMRLTELVSRHIWPNGQFTFILDATELLAHLWERLDDLENQTTDASELATIHEARIYLLKAMGRLDGVIAPMTKYIIKNDPSWYRKFRAVVIWLGSDSRHKLDDRLLNRK